MIAGLSALFTAVVLVPASPGVRTVRPGTAVSISRTTISTTGKTDYADLIEVAVRLQCSDELQSDGARARLRLLEGVLRAHLARMQRAFLLERHRAGEVEHISGAHAGHV